MASPTGRRPVLGLLALAIAAPMLGAQGAHATPIQAGSVVNSAKGLIGCLSDSAFQQSKFAIYCLAMQVPSTGADAGRLTTDTWACVYDSASAQFLPVKRVVLSPSALKVSQDGSFTFSARLPRMGRVSIVAAGGEHEVATVPITRVIGPTGYRPQGFTLASPGDGLTNYGLDPTTVLGPTGLPGSSTASLISASVNGHLQDELIGSVWRGPTSGEWDYETC